MSHGEFAFIRDHLLPLTRGDRAALELSDDAACLELSGNSLLASDMLVEGVHFLRSDGPAVAAQRAFGSNLSDLAAMGAIPRGFLCTVCWPTRYSTADREAFVDALGVVAAAENLALLGGDMTRADAPLTISLTMIGETTSDPLRRNGAKPGDQLFVSGTIGDAVLGLSIAKGELDKQDFLLERYQRPQARIELGQTLLNKATACIDISDGLAADAQHLARESGVGLEIEGALIPWSAPVLHWLENEGRAGVETLITGGDDYELLFTAPVEHAASILALKRTLGVDVTWIGQVVEGEGVRIQDEMGVPLDIETSGFTHF
ncbi:MAG: thiamine-phosphate kinase [Alphaproteobacteria bacterium]|nr:thiamine-phosphate kinase [Alphaproteobacteria bacterium]